MEEKKNPAPEESQILNWLDPWIFQKKNNSQIIKYLSESKWIEKNEACKTIEKILLEANMEILLNGLNELFNLIKSKKKNLNHGQKCSH